VNNHDNDRSRQTPEVPSAKGSNPLRGMTTKSINSERAQPSPEEIVAAALNEQGYLLQYKVASVVRSPAKKGQLQHDWHIEASEVPVSLPNGDETRIDIVLNHGAAESSVWRIVAECKRAARDYKRWVFFGENCSLCGPHPDNCYIERADLAGMWNHQGEPPMMHRVETRPAPAHCPILEVGVESRLNRGTNDKKSSATTAIEDAFQQVTLGQAGLALRLRNAHVLNFRLLPVVVTTADLISANLSVDQISLDSGMIDPSQLRLEPRKWLAVNFRMSDVACRFSGIGTVNTKDLGADLAARQVRTVFVVQAANIQEFLVWLEYSFVKVPQ
jgi:hypothetical protein